MPMYDVHIMAVCRVKVWNVEAETMEAAITIAEQEADLKDMYRSGRPIEGRPGDPLFVEDCGYNEGVESYLVDVVGDEGFTESAEFEADGRTDAIPDLLKFHSPNLLAVAKAVAETMSADDPRAMLLNAAVAQCEGRPH